MPLFISILLFYVVIPIVILRLYLNYLKNATPSKGDEVFYYDGELTFESIKGQLEKIEKVKGVNLDSCKEQLSYYKLNAQLSGRDASYYYNDYLAPGIKKYLVGNANFSYMDTPLRWMCIYWAILVMGPFTLIYSNYIIEAPYKGGQMPMSMAAGVAIIILAIGFQILILLLKIFTIYMDSKEEEFREKGYPLGAISKSIIAVESVIAFIFRSKKIGADNIFGGGVISGGLGGSSGSGSSGGGGFGGFGGGRSGGGGASGTW